MAIPFCTVSPETIPPQPAAGTSSEIMNKSKWHMINHYAINKFITHVEPLMGDLQKIVISKVMNHWVEVAEALRYDEEDIEAIQQKERCDQKQCCREFFKDWLRSKHGTGPKTWSTLFNVLKDPDRDLFEDSIVEGMIAKVMQLQTEL